MIKWILIAIILACCYVVQAGAPWTMHGYYNKAGQPMVFVVNHTGYGIYCVIWDDQGYYEDFAVAAESRSYAYHRPQGNIEWGCE